MNSSPGSWLGFGLAVAGWTIVHFAWQGAALGVVVEGLLAALRRATPIARERVVAFAVVLMVMVFAATGIKIAANALDRGPASFGGGIGIGSPEVALNAAAPWLGLVWILAVELALLRLMHGWLRLRRLRARGREIVDPGVVSLLHRSSARLGIRRRVRLLVSEEIEGPILIGWHSPDIVLPARALDELDAAGLEAVMAHELAHVRRGDAVTKILQALAGAALSAHPSVRRLLARIDQEREQACDDLALEACSSPLTYARTLARLERLRRVDSPLALAAGGGTLLHRVRRIVRPAPALPTWSAAALALASIVTLVLAARASVAVASARSLVMPEVSAFGFHDPHDPDAPPRPRPHHEKGHAR